MYSESTTAQGNLLWIVAISSKNMKVQLGVWLTVSL